MDFNNKVVLVTGASSGIGAAIAIKFAENSAQLSLIGRNADNLRRVGEQCEKIGARKHLRVVADVSREDDIVKIVDETLKHYGRIDVLVNNAGVATIGGSEDPVATYDGIMSTNIRGAYILTKRAEPHLIASKGTIINISSMLSYIPNPSMTTYCMSKAAMDMFTKCLALELGPKGVRVNSVNPGPVRTEIFKRAGIDDGNCAKLFEMFEKTTPLRRVAVGEDVAEVVVFLASDKARCVTGSSYVIDCGKSYGDYQAL